MPLGALAPLLLALSASAAGLRTDATRPLCAVYRFDPAIGPLKDLPPEALAAKLAAWGLGAVFGRPADAVRDALRAKGIRVFASLACFQGARHWKRRPDSRPVTAAGARLATRSWYAGVCPSQEPVLRELEAEASRLARRYDGVWLDFMRYPGYWEEPDAKPEETCFCPVCLERFAEFADLEYPSGAAASTARAEWILGERRDDWIRFKVETIRQATGRIAEAVKRSNPSALVGLFSVPWPAQARRATLGQDLAALAPSLDTVSPMAYAAMLGRPATWITEVVNDARDEAGRPSWPAVVLPGKESKRGPAFSETLARALAPPSEGVILLSWPLGRHADAVGEACGRARQRR